MRADDPGLPHADRSPPSSPTHRLPDFFELSEYDFEELCEELVRSLDGVKRATPKNRRGNPQFGVDVEGYSAQQKPFVVLSAKREKGPTKAKIKKWNNDFLKHIAGHWQGKGVERFILACADEIRGDQVNGQITTDALVFSTHAIVFDPWDRKEIVRLLRSRRELVEAYLHPAWIERICGTSNDGSSPPLAGASGAGPSGVTSTIPNMAKVAALAERLAESTRRELELAIAEAHRWRASALDAFLARIRTDSVQWDALPDRDKARVLRLSAARTLSREDHRSACRLAGEAAAFHEAEDRTLEALLLRAEERMVEALACLESPRNDAERHARAGLLIELGRSSEALALLGTSDPATAAPGDAETLRLTMLAWLVERQPETALAIRARAHPVSAGDDAGLAWACAVAHFNAALARGASPDLGAFPNPIDRSLFREDAASLDHLDEATRRFADLAASVGADEREDLEVWQLAALSSNPTRGEEAEAKARSLLSRANPHPGAVAWALARGYDVNPAKIRRSYRDLLAANRGTASHLAVLVGLELSLGQVSRAERLVREDGVRFTSANDRALIQFWVEQIGQAKAGEGAQPSLPAGLSEAFSRALAGDDEAASALTEGLVHGVADAQAVATIAERLAKAGRHAAVSKLTPQLLGFGTARGVSLAARAAFFIGDWQRAVETLRDRTTAFAGGRLPRPLARLQVEAAWRLGDAGAALDYARAAAISVGADGTEAMRDLAVLHHQLGDVRGAAFQLRQLPDMTSLPERDAIVFARDIRQHDPELAGRLLRHAARDLADPGIVAEGMRLALDIRDDALAREVFGPAFRRLAESGEAHSIVRAVGATEAAVALREAAQGFEQAWQLWLSAAIPTHVVFGDQWPDVMARLFDRHRALDQADGLPPLLVRPGRRDDERSVETPIGEWHLTLDLTALLLADALDLLDVVTHAATAITVPPSLPEALRTLEESIRPIQPFMRDTEAHVLAAIERGRVSNVPDEDLGGRRVVRERDAPSSGPSFRDLAAMLRDRCGVQPDRIEALLAGDRAPGDAGLLDPGAAVVINVGRLVQLQACGLLDTALDRLDVAVRRSEADGLAHKVANDARARATAERLAQLRERVADRLASRVWSLLPQAAEQEDEEQSSAPERCLRELLAAPMPNGGSAHALAVAWVEDRFVSGFDSIEHRTTLVTVEEVLSALQAGQALSAAEWARSRTKLRRMGYAFLPFVEGEISDALASAPSSDDHLVETEVLAIIRRHLALQLEAFAHAGVGEEFRRPDGRSDDAGILAHLFGLWRRMMPVIWGRFAHDRRRRHLAADWVLKNLRVETFPTGPFAQRPPELLERLRIQASAWLIIQAISIREPSGGTEESETDQWERRRALIGDYVRFVLAAVIEPLAEAEMGNADAIATVLAEWALRAAEPLPGMAEQFGAERADRAFLTITKLVLVELPARWLNRLASKPGFKERFGELVIHRIEFGPFACAAADFWPAVERAFAEGEARVALDEPELEAVIRRQGMDGGPPSILIEAGGTRAELSDPAVAVAHPDETVRRPALEHGVDWIEGSPERKSQTIEAIRAMPEVLPRMAALEQVRWASLTWRLRKIASEVRDRNTTDWSLLEPPSPQSIVDHLRLDAVGRDFPLVDAVEVATGLLRADLPIEFAAARLAGLVVAPQDALLAALAAWLGSDPALVAERFEAFAATPLRAWLAMRALLAHGAPSPNREEQCFALLADAFEDGLTLFRAILRWVARVTARRPDWRALGIERRSAFTWAYADLLAATLLSEEVDREATAQTFEERETLSEGDLRWHGLHDGSLVERAEHLASRAIAGVILGDLFASMEPGTALSDGLNARLRDLTASPSGPYAGPELLCLGRPGWSWMDIDPLPILSRVFQDFGPENLTSLDRRGRAELLARQLASETTSDVAALLVIVIGVDALDQPTALDLLEKLREDVTPERIASQETLGSLRAEANLAAISRNGHEPTDARFAEVAMILGARYRGAVPRPSSTDGAQTSAGRHLHALLEIAWTLAGVVETQGERLERFVELALRLVQSWPETRSDIANLVDRLTNGLPMPDLVRLQPRLERVRRA